MLTYQASFKFLPDGGVHREVRDFPGVITWGETLDEARRSLHGALVDMAQSTILQGEALLTPGRSSTNLDADLEEPIHVLTP